MTVTLVEPYNPAWPDWFARIKAFVERQLGDKTVRIEHVGSTAVPAMTAKPIIDIDIIVEPADLSEAIRRLADAGYVHQGDLGIPGREAFELTDEERKVALPPHHLYVCPVGSAELKRHLAFRDFLRAHPDHAQRLSELKRSLCEQFDNDRQAYMDGKAALVRQITELALSG